MSPELETLDQLDGGDLPLAVIRGLYPDDAAFARGVHALLKEGKVQLLSDGTEVAEWRWRELFEAGEVVSELGRLKLALTEQGAHYLNNGPDGTP